MGRSTPVMKTRCSNCLKNRKLGTFNPAPSGNVVSYSRVGYPILTCPVCGHVWVSRSKVGRRLRRRHESNQPPAPSDPDGAGAINTSKYEE